MLWTDNQHPELISLLESSSQSYLAEISFLDGDVLLDHNVSLLSPDQGRLARDFLKNGDMGRSTRSWVGCFGVRAVRLAELSLPY